MKNKFFFKGMLALGAALCLGSFTAQAYKVNRIPAESKGAGDPTISTLYEVTADDIINAGNWHEQDSQAYIRSDIYGDDYMLDLMHRAHTGEMWIEKVNDYRIKVHGMFGGLVTVEFIITDEDPLYTNSGALTVSRLKLVTNDFVQGSYSSYPFFRAKKANGNTGFNVREVHVYPMIKKYSHSNYGGDIYSDPIQLIETTGEPDALMLNFFQSNYDYASGSFKVVKFLGTVAGSETEYVDYLSMQSYESSCTIEDTQVIREGTQDRSFRGEFEWDANGANTFQFAGLGGCYAATVPQLTNYLQGTQFNTAWFSNAQYFTGTYNLDNMTAKITKQPISVDVREFPYDTRYSDANKVYQFNTCRVDANGNYEGEEINGILVPRDEDVNHKGTNSWVTHGGNRTTWTNIDIELTDNWAPYNYYYTKREVDPELGYFTKTIIRPDKKKEVEVTHHVELLEAAMSHDKDYDYIWVKNEKGEDVKKGYFKVSAIVHPIKNHRYVGGYNVYYEEGTVSSWSDVDNNNRKQLDNSTLTRNSDGTYTYTGRYFPKGEEIMENQKLTAEITLYVETVYAGAATASESKTAVADLTPTHHALTPLRSDITTGVNELYKESVAIESTENGVIANGEFTGEVEVYSANGMLVAKGVANEEIALDGNGIFIVRAGGKTAKIVK